jgi:hypothetical protein
MGLTLIPQSTTRHRRPAAAAAVVGTCEPVARASAGEQVAWDQLVERYGGLV